MVVLQVAGDEELDRLTGMLEEELAQLRGR